jgi:phosphate starvation-inducible PhoH-like protein
MQFMPRKIKEDNLFFGLQSTMTDEQKIFRDAIYGDSYDIVFCNSKAGTGKTTIAVATAKMLVEEKKYDGMVYIVIPVQEKSQGYLPGNLNEKNMPYAEPLMQALVKVGDQPDRAIKQMADLSVQKNGLAWVDCLSHTFLRGVNFENKVIIIDELENAKVDEIKKILTRCHASCKIIAIGHTGQCDLQNKKLSGFEKYINHFKEKERCKVCTLTKNFRGWVSQWADELEE